AQFGDKLIGEVIPQTLTEIAQAHFDFLGERMHVLTGAMKGSRQINQVSEEEVDVGVGVPYARKENSRSGTKPGFGTHQFWEPSIGDTITMVPEIVNRNIDTLSNLG